MKPAPFDYLRPASLAEALEALAVEGAMALAGGQSLIAMLNMRLARPDLLVDIVHLPELRGRGLRVGAAVRQAELTGLHPLIDRALPHVGHYQTRARGTFCGSVAHADPAAELPLCLVALGGRVHLASARGERCIEAADFFEGPLMTAREEDELIVAVELPPPDPHAGYAFREVALRHGDFALAAFAAVADDAGVRLAVGGVADTPVVLDGLAIDADAIDARDDFHADAAYRRRLVDRVGRATVEEALSCRA